MVCCRAALSINLSDRSGWGSENSKNWCWESEPEQVSSIKELSDDLTSTRRIRIVNEEEK